MPLTNGFQTSSSMPSQIQKPVSPLAYSISICSRAKVNTITSPNLASSTANFCPAENINDPPFRSFAISPPRAKYVRFSGTSVPGDFVEAPSQMLENWVWDKKVLDSFAADYRDPSKKIPAEILAKLKEAKFATEATRYRRQLSFGLTDMALHTQIHDGNVKEALPLSNKVLGEVFFPMAPDTAFVAYFGHLMQYDAGYYGYAWADAIAADMATVFEQAKNGYFDQNAGHRLRTEIYETGDSRDLNISIEKFLGRKRSLAPFLK